MALLIYFICILCFSLYSYALLDPNITFFQTSWWEFFRNTMVQIGYHQRQTSWNIYLILVVCITIGYYFFTLRYKNYNPLVLAIGIGVLTVISYPFLSHDFFNYLFDAKILTFYQQNPYTHKALDFPDDSWLRFMHWTHRTYPYGPTFLPITLIPSLLSFGKFVLAFFLFKLVFIGLYIASVWVLQKMNRLWAMMFALHPLIIVEGLVNTHNDFMAVALGIIGIFFLMKKGRKNQMTAGIFFILSGGIKYFTLPLLLLIQKNTKWQLYIACLVLGMILYVSFTSEIQPWYFLNMLVFIPLYPKLIQLFTPFFIGVLFSYYPYIALGGWDTPDKVVLEHTIIWIAVVVNGVVIVVKHFKK